MESAYLFQEFDLTLGRKRARLVKQLDQKIPAQC